MKIHIHQKEENGIFTVSLTVDLPELAGLRIGDKAELTTNKESRLPYTQAEKDAVLSDATQRLFKRLFLEYNHKNKQPV